MKQKFEITYDWTFDMVVIVDRDIMTDEKLHEINNFWSGAKERLRDEEGNVLHAVLVMLALRAFVMTITDLDPEGKLRRGEIEGWPKLDGSEGIELVDLDYFELDPDEIMVKEVSHG